MRICKSKIYLNQLDENTIIDLRKKEKFSIDTIKEEEKDLSIVLQPELKTDFDLETNMFGVYPQSNIPFSNSNSWIGM